MNIADFVRDINDFPIKGVIYKDITPVLKDHKCFELAVNQMADLLKNIEFDYIVSPEARGFIFGSALAYKLNKGLIPIRKKGKLPYKTVSEKYKLEYGEAVVEIHADALTSGDKVVLVDDVLATGGTSAAIISLVQKSQATVEAVVNLIELQFLHPEKMLAGQKILSVVKYT